MAESANLLPLSAKGRTMEGVSMGNRDDAALVKILAWGVLVVAGAVLLLLGVTTAVSSGRQIKFSRPVAYSLGAVSAFALMVLVLLIALAVAGWLIERLLDSTTRRIKEGAPYLPYIVVSAGVLTGAAAKPFDNDLTASFVIGAVTAIVTAFAAKIVQRKPIWGLAVFLVLPIVLCGVAILTGNFHVHHWLSSLERRDWTLLAVGVLILVGVPVFVGLVERWKGTDVWRFERLGRSRAELR